MENSLSINYLDGDLGPDLFWEGDCYTAWLNV